MSTFFKTLNNQIIDIMEIKRVYIEPPSKGFCGNGDKYIIRCYSHNDCLYSLSGYTHESAIKEVDRLFNLMSESGYK